MDFRESLSKMKEGRRVKRPHWSGYWYWNNIEGTVMMHCKEGRDIDIFDTNRKDYTLLNIAANDFICIPEEKQNIRVFISQPMKGKSNEEILSDRKEAISYLESILGHVYNLEIIDSFIKNTPHEDNPVYCLGESIRLLSLADLVYFTKGWKKARGCCIEYDVAVAYNISRITNDR